MKKMRIACVILALFTMICFAGSALGAGIEPPADGSDCLCIEENGQPDVKIKGPYQKGTFTISNGANNGDSFENTADVFISHLFLQWGNRIFLSPYISFTTGPETICHPYFTDEIITSLIVADAAVCKLDVEEAFDLEGTPLVKAVIITDRAGCDTPSIFDDIVRGEIIVGVVPTSLVVDEDGCVVPPTD